MSNSISSKILRDINDISLLVTNGDIIINLTQLLPSATNNITLGYYFADRSSRIIAGKVISTANNIQKQPGNYIKISADDIPAEAVTLSFFVD